MPVTSYHGRQPSAEHFLNLRPAVCCGSSSFLCLSSARTGLSDNRFPECQNCLAVRASQKGFRELLGKAPEVLELCEARRKLPVEAPISSESSFLDIGVQTCEIPQFR